MFTFTTPRPPPPPATYRFQFRFYLEYDRGVATTPQQANHSTQNRKEKGQRNQNHHKKLKNTKIETPETSRGLWDHPGLGGVECAVPHVHYGVTCPGPGVGANKSEGVGECWSQVSTVGKDRIC